MCVCACVRVPVCVCVCNSLGYQTWWKNFSRNYPRSTHATRWVRTKNLLLSLSLSWQTEATTLAELDYCFAPAATCSTSCSFCLPVCLSVCFAVQITFPNKHLHYAESSHGKPSVYVGRIFNQFVDAAFLIPAAPAVAAFTATFVVCRLFLGFCVCFGLSCSCRSRIMPDLSVYLACAAGWMPLLVLGLKRRDCSWALFEPGSAESIKRLWAT